MYTNKHICGILGFWDFSLHAAICKMAGNLKSFTIMKKYLKLAEIRSCLHATQCEMAGNLNLFIFMNTLNWREIRSCLHATICEMAANLYLFIFMNRYFELAGNSK